MHMYNFKLYFHPFEFADYYERRFNWIYFYKCQYSCILLLFVGFFVAHKDKFLNIIVYFLSLAVLFVCLYIAHTNTSMIGAGLIVAADLLDEFFKDHKFIIAKIRAAVEKIKANPQGIGNRFVLNRDDWFHFDNFNTNNCHNIFLNEMLRYSIPVGCCYAAFFIVTAIYSLIKKFSFSRLATWLAFFLAVSMDYSIQTPELSMVMFMLYCIFFYPLEKNN